MEEGDLAFASGDVIVLLDLADEEWARGYVEGRPELVGDFPRSFVNIESQHDSLRLREENRLLAVIESLRKVEENQGREAVE